MYGNGLAWGMDIYGEWIGIGNGYMGNGLA